MRTHLTPTRNRRQPSISRALTLSLILTVVVVAIVLMFINYQVAIRKAKTQLDKQADEYLSFLLDSLSVPMWNFEADTIRHIGSAYAQNDIVSTLEIENADGGVYFRSVKEYAGFRTQRESPVLFQGRFVGIVRLSLNSHAFSAFQAQLLRYSLIALAGILIAIVAMTGFLLRLFLKRPLCNLCTLVDDYSSGAGNLPVYPHVSREFQPIIEGLAAMNARINRHMSELQQAEKKYRNIFDAAKDAIIILSHNKGQILDANHYACKLYGYSRDEMLALKSVDLSADPQKTMAELRSEINWIPIRYHKKKNGSIFPTEISISYFELDGRGLSASVIRDISYRLKTENEKRQLEAQLQRGQKMEAIGTLAGGVAHDLNNILSGIVGYPELLLMDLPADSPFRNSILAIQKSGLKAAAIVQDLLTLARRGIAPRDIVNVNHIVSEYLKSPEFSNIKSDFPGIALAVKLEADLLTTMGSSVHLSKTVMNLVTNALESIVGDGNIEIATHNRYIDKPIRGYEEVHEGDYVVLSITDTGMGVD